MVENKNDLPISHENWCLILVLRFHPFVSNRNRVSSTAISSSEDERKKCESIVGCIPKSPIEEIKRKAEARDSGAILDLADCLMFGLKGQQRYYQN